MRAAVVLAVSLVASCADFPAPRLNARSEDTAVTKPANDDFASDDQGMRGEFHVMKRGIGSGRGESSAIPARFTDKLPAQALKSDDANGDPPARADVPVSGGGTANRCDLRTQACPAKSREAQEPRHKWSVGKVLWRGFLVLFIIAAVGILRPW